MTTLLTLMLSVATAATFATDHGTALRPTAGNDREVRVPASWAPADEADALWKEARSAFSDGDWDSAAKLFKRLVEKYPKSTYAGDALYYAAYANFKIGDTPSLRRALGQLETQAQKYPNSSTVKNREAKSLATRIEGGLARLGDPQAAASVVDRATRAAGPGASAGGIGGIAYGGGASAGPARIGSASSSASAGSPARISSAGNIPEGCKSEEEDERIEALNALLQMNAEQALPILKQVMAKRQKCSEMLRRKAVFLISQKRSAETADLLLEAARTDPDAEVREQAVFWLSQVSGEKAEEFLVGLLRDSKDLELQKKAIFALAQRKSDKAQKSLRDYAGRDDVPAEVRNEVIFWISQNHMPENATFLRTLFNKTNSAEVREKVLFALSQMRGSGNEAFLLEQVSNTKLPVETRKQALFWASQNRDVGIGQLTALYDKSSEREMRDQVIFVLSQRSARESAAVDKLLEIAKTEKDKELRKQAIFWLGQSKDPRAAKLLLELIDR